ncbi:MAG: thioesterase family protein [Candidatus Thermoplasmatota archaeon]|nr:thioesterase family protein [Candidatus Thermoplasmatota archaeon]
MEERQFMVTRKIRVMTYEIDFAGIVSNQVYFRWLEDMRMDLLTRYMDLREMIKDGRLPVLAHSEIDYRRPLKLLDDVEGRIWVEELVGPKWALASEFVRDGEVVARARQWGVFIDTGTFRPIDAPEAFPQVLKR